MTESISLYGGLARSFQRKYKYNPKCIEIVAKTAREAINALEANFPGFKRLIKKNGAYRVVSGDTITHGKELTHDEVEMKLGRKQWHFMPVAAGCGAVTRIIFGIALIAIAVIGGPAGWAVAGYGAGMFGATVAGGLAMMGASMILGGVSQLLTPTPSNDYDQRERPDERPSYLFDGPKNTVEPGLTIPVVYGECFVGSITVSGGLRIQDLSYDIVEKTEEVDAEEPADDSDKFGSSNTDKWGSGDAEDNYK